MTMTRPGRVRRVLGCVGAGVLVLVLTGCNPQEIKAVIYPRMAEVRYSYKGPSDVWFEVKVRGTEGYVVATNTIMYVLDHELHPEKVETRTCGDSKVRGLRVDCGKGYAGWYFVNPYHRSDLDVPGMFWPAAVVRDGEEVRVHVHCYLSDPGPVGPQIPDGVTCPASTVVEARVVDNTGKLVGDLTKAGGY